MRNFIPKILIGVLAVTMAIPESYARRMGGGRSVGRQSQMTRQRPALPPAQRAQPIPVQPPGTPPLRQQPDLARQNAPIAPLPPTTPISRPAASPWGGMLGGALVGMGLGSLLSSGQRNANPAPQDRPNQGAVDPATGNRTSGAASNGTDGTGSGDSRPGATAQQKQPQESRFGFLLWPGLFALGTYLLIRRMRRRRVGL